MHKLYLPRLGQTMEHGIIAQWLKAEGESLEIGDPLYEVETEKSTVEVEAKSAGTLVRIVVQTGEEVPTGTVLGIVADPGEMLSEEEIVSVLSEFEAAASQSAAATSEAEFSPRPSGEAGVTTRAPQLRASPRAAALAAKLGVDLATIVGSGGERITAADVERASSLAGPSAPRIRERRPLRGIRRTVAEVVARSWAEVPQFVQQISVDATGLSKRRQSLAPQLQAEFGLSLSYTDMILQAVVQAATEVPDANASFRGDEIVLYEDVNVSVAVATDAGLLVPVIHRAQELTLPQIAIRLRELAERGRAGSLRPEEAEGGTITVSNLGMFGVETGTPLVMAPQAAIVFGGAIVDRPVAVEGTVQIRPILGLALAYDHRVLDGVSAAKFTAAVKRLLQSGS